MWKSAGANAAGSIIGILLFSSLASAIEINGYSSTHNDRFSSGYPTVPIANTNSNFIGLGYDWSGIGWNAANPTQSVALLGPQFFLYGNHYAPGTSLQFCSSDGQVKPYSVQTLSGGLGPDSTSDLAVGVLSSPIPASDHVAYYSILFLGYSSNSYTSAGNNNILVYGHQGNGSTNGPAIGAGTIDSVSNGLWINENGTPVFHTGYYFGYPYSPPGTDTATLEGGDSSSPSFFYSSQTHSLYLAGAHYAVGGGYNYDSALPLMLNYVNTYMAQTGYLPYVVTPPTATWSGTLNGSWKNGGAGGNWSGSNMPADVLTGGLVTTCASVLFDGASTSQNTIYLNGSRTVTGITFKSAPGPNGFTIATGSSGSLTIGEAGITNNDDDVQTLTCNIALRSPQRWNIGTGGLLVSGTIDTDSGDLLLIEGDGNATLSGQIFNSGALAKDGLGTLTLSSNTNNTYTGQTFIHGGVLQIGNGTAAGSLGTGAVTDNATLAFNRSNVITVSNIISGSGMVQQIGSGTLILSGSNSYSGTTTVTNGILQLANPSALGTTAGGTIVQNGGALDLNGLNIGNELLTIYGTGSGGIGALVNSNALAPAIFNGAVTLGGNAGTGGSGNITLAGSMNYGSVAFTKNGSGTLTLTGSQIWGNNASATVQAGTLTYQQAAGVTTTLGTISPTLHIAAGAVLNDYASNNDPFTDALNPTQHVQIVNDLGGSFNLMAGISSVAGISGAGSTSVAAGATLNSNYIYQGTLTLAPGARVVINPISGGPTASSSSLYGALSTMPISNLATNPAALSPSDMPSSSVQTGVINPASLPTSTVPIGLTLVPEPATWILIIIGALCLLCLGKRK